MRVSCDTHIRTWLSTLVCGSGRILRMQTFQCKSDRKGPLPKGRLRSIDIERTQIDGSDEDFVNAEFSITVKETRIESLARAKMLICRKQQNRATTGISVLVLVPA
jgi:hypothetical protein